MLLFSGFNFVCGFVVKEVFQFYVITDHIEFYFEKFGGILKFVKIRISIFV